MEQDQSTLKAFEEAIAQSKPDGQYRLRLYVSGSTPRSIRAIANLRALCNQYIDGRYELEVVDLYQQPERAKDGQVIAAPTLVREFPEPARRVVGDMSDLTKVLVALDIERIVP